MRSARAAAQHTGAPRAACALIALALTFALPPLARARERTPVARWTPALEAEAALLEAELAKSLPARDGALRVRLAFGGAADLDLYVTDPRAETIYFANERAAAGGRLLADARCASPSPRIEEVVFAAPVPGRYRIGVDYMVYREECGEQPAVMAYVLAIDTPRGRRFERGLARRGLFEAERVAITLPESR